MNDYPYYSVKITTCINYQLNNTHEGLTEYHLTPNLRFATEIDAIKAAMDTLRERYIELEQEDDNA